MKKKKIHYSITNFGGYTFDVRIKGLKKKEVTSVKDLIRIMEIDREKEVSKNG
jgi:hypothetical protein